jgi:hypothetical protein
MKLRGGEFQGEKLTCECSIPAYSFCFCGDILRWRQHKIESLVTIWGKAALQKFLIYIGLYRNENVSPVICIKGLFVTMASLAQPN